MNKIEGKAKELILIFMPHCAQHEFGKYVDNLLHQNARDCAKKCVLEIIKSDHPSMSDYWNEVLKAIEIVRL